MGYAHGVGREAPTFVLNAHDGTEINLKQYRGDWFPVLVFFSAEAPQAAEALTGLTKIAGTLWGLRGQVLGVTVADGDAVRELAGDVPALSFPLLADDGRVADAYGAGKAARGQAPPLVFVLDRAGKVVWTGEGDKALKQPALLDAFRSVAR